MSEAAASLSPGERNELEIGVVLQRNFIGLADDEFTELTILTEGARWIWQCSSVESHIEGLRLGQGLRGFIAAFMLHNRPLDPRLAARYEQDTLIRAPTHRASDKDIQASSTVYIDCDAIRPSGISSTNNEFRAALDVSWKVRDWLASELGPLCLGHGISGNGAFLLLAVEVEPDPPAWTARISTFLKLLNKKFSTDLVKIDCSVTNPARIVPCAGTWKRKGVDSRERPHRMVTFSYRVGPNHGAPERVRLGDIL